METPITIPETERPIQKVKKQPLPSHWHGRVRSIVQLAFNRTTETALWQNTQTLSSLAKANACLISPR